MQSRENITSRSNPKLIKLRKVRDGNVPGEIFIEGVRLAEEGVRSGLVIFEGFVTKELEDNERGAELANVLYENEVKLFEVPDAVIRDAAETVSPQGIILRAQKPVTGEEVLRAATSARSVGPLLILHEPNDPSNVGAILRSAEAAGAVGLIVSKRGADAFSPKALRASMGASFRVPVWDKVNTAAAMEWARERGRRVIAADISATIDVFESELGEALAIVLGSEAHGLSEEILELADDIVRIPMCNGVESLNLAVSAGIILFESLRQRRKGERPSVTES